MTEEILDEIRTQLSTIIELLMIISGEWGGEK